MEPLLQSEDYIWYWEGTENEANDRASEDEHKITRYLSRRVQQKRRVDRRSDQAHS